MQPDAENPVSRGIKNEPVVEQRLTRSFKRFKDRAAIEWQDQVLTYSELDRLTDVIAGRIVRGGVPPESMIGLYVDLRRDFILAMIAIFKAGCCFVPLDSALPVNRLQAMIAFTALRRVITDEAGRLHLASTGPGKERSPEFLLLDDLWSAPPEADSLPAAAVRYHPRAKSYIYFTSGSTGQPKAVVGRNRGLLHFIDWEIDTFAVDETDRFSQLTTPGFDVFLRDILVPLCAGAAVCIPCRPETLLDRERLGRWIDNRQITLIHCVPSLFRQINRDTLGNGLYRSLKYILLAGEKVVPDQLRSWYKIMGERIRLVNLYGPTETTLAKVFYLMGKADSERRIMPVGRAIDGARVIILDEDMEVCGQSVAGEVYIRTPFRSFGYLNDPALSREKFIPNPFGRDPGDVIYRTGDLGRLLPDGNIELLGRKDRQVKIRGMRIEPEEIEGVLLRHEAVREAAVVKREISDRSEFLLAFVQENEPAEPPDHLLTQELTEYLSAELPAYMIPSRIIRIRDFPRKPNGKIDFEGLHLLADDAGEERLPPRNEVEEGLTAIWIDILQNGKIGVTDNFFEAGGNSLNLMALITRIRREFDTQLSLSEIFECNTIEKQARIVSARRKQAAFIPVNAVEKREYYPLSSAQSRLYILHQLEPAATGYNLPQSVPLEEKPDRRRLARVIDELVRNHESLRTSFHVVRGRVVQRVVNGVDFKIEYYDAAELDSSSAAAAAMKNFVRPFNLSRPPLFRVAVLSGGGNRTRLLVDMHHIIADGLSLDIMIQDFFTLYEGKRLTPLPLQYKDYSLWQNRPLYRENLEMQRTFWLNMFPGEIPVLNLPADYARPAVRSFAGDIRQVHLEEAEITSLRALAAREEVTVFMLLLAAYFVFLARISGQDDIVVGTPVAGRRHADLERIIGMFVNTLPLRCRVAADETFSYFLETMKKRCLDALENQEYPFEDLVEQVRVRRDTARNPIFDVLFTHHRLDLSVPEAAASTPPVAADDHRSSFSRTAKLDLSLAAAESGDRLSLTVEYSTRLFKAAAIDRFIRGYRNILGSITAAPEKEIVRIDMMSGMERNEILASFNRTGTDYPRQASIQALFACQARLRQDSLAVSFRDNRLSYGCLDGISTRLAALLRQKGAAPGDIVGIMSHPMPELVIGILAILKAGAAYLPVNPDYPSQRKSYMLRDCGSRLMLTTLPAAEEIGVNVLHLPHCLIHVRQEGLMEEGGASDLAYIIYTSGSTGRPKGVMVEHRGVVRLVKNTNYLVFRKDDRWQQVSALDFDASTLEIWGALLNGGLLCLADKEIILNAERFKRNLHRCRVNIMCMSTPLFNQLLAADEGIFAGLEFLLVGGDILPPLNAERLLRKFPALKFFNGYGPTENTTLSTAFLLDREYERSVPIGPPVANSTAYIVDGYRRVQPVGITGELLLGGDGLARGYLNAPELTSRRFRRYSFRDGFPPCRVYRSGDLGRWLPDGGIEFIGRVDAQVKIRGFRVELGEIENRLLQHPHIRQVAVSVARDRENEKKIVAYLVANNPVPMAELREFLAVRLPDYMIPSHFIRLPQLPLTSGGKIDISRLGEEGLELQAGGEHVEPRDDVEKEIAGIWKEVLGVDRVGIFDNFFEIGGNSLKLVLLNERLQEIFEREISVTSLFRYPTIGSLARYLNHHRHAEEMTLPPRDADSYRKNKKSNIIELRRRKGVDKNKSK